MSLTRTKLQTDNQADQHHGDACQPDSGLANVASGNRNFTESQGQLNSEFFYGRLMIRKKAFHSSNYSSQ